MYVIRCNHNPYLQFSGIDKQARWVMVFRRSIKFSSVTRNTTFPTTRKGICQSVWLKFEVHWQETKAVDNVFSSFSNQQYDVASWRSRKGWWQQWNEQATYWRGRSPFNAKNRDYRNHASSQFTFFHFYI